MTKDLIKTLIAGSIQLRNSSSGTQISPEYVNVNEIFEGSSGQLKTLNERQIIDTCSMSDPITEMYTEFNRL